MFIVCTFSAYFFIRLPATTVIYTLSLHDALPISSQGTPAAENLGSIGGYVKASARIDRRYGRVPACARSEEHTSELQSLTNLVCRLLLEKKKTVGAASGMSTRRGIVTRS